MGKNFWFAQPQEVQIALRVARVYALDGARVIGFVDVQSLDSQRFGIGQLDELPLVIGSAGGPGGSNVAVLGIGVGFSQSLEGRPPVGLELAAEVDDGAGPGQSGLRSFPPQLGRGAQVGREVDVVRDLETGRTWIEGFVEGTGSIAPPVVAGVDGGRAEVVDAKAGEIGEE